MRLLKKIYKLLQLVIVISIIALLIVLDVKIMYAIIIPLIIAILFSALNLYIYYKGVVSTPINQIKYRKPNIVLYYLLMAVLYPLFKLKNKVKYDRTALKGLKGPFIILSNHPTRPDFVYNASLIFPRRVNTVADRSLFYNRKTRFLLLALGAIPKNLFWNDIQTIKMVMAARKNNMCVLMMPEGRLSTTNKNDPITEATAKLIKKLDMPVVTVKIQGAYFLGGKWVNNKRRGKILVTAKLLYNREDLAMTSDDEINNSISKALENDDNEFLEKNHIHYKGKDLIENLDSILYVCPNCNSEFKLIMSNNQVHCHACNLNLKLNSQFYFVKEDDTYYEYKTIFMWHRYQIERISLVVKTPDFELRDKFKLRMPNIQKGIMEEVGVGVCVLNEDGLSFLGTINGEKTNLFFPSNSLPVLPFICKQEIEIYRDDTYYAFEPLTDPKTVIKWALACEANYNNQFRKK